MLCIEAVTLSPNPAAPAGAVLVSVEVYAVYPADDTFPADDMYPCEPLFEAS